MGHSRDGSKQSVREGGGGMAAMGGGAIRNIPIHVEDSPGNSPGKQRKRDRIFGFAMTQMEKHYPQVVDKILKLKDYYNWCMDSESELSLLKKIVEGAK